MLRKIIALVAVICAFALPAAAQRVTVEGVGGDKASALADVKRVAVTEVVGTYIDSRTLVNESELALDEILTKAAGFVTDVKILNESSVGGMYTIKADVEVSENSALASRLSTIMSLNDPRIAIIVLREGSAKHEERVEAAMMDSLISAGFNHIVDADVVAGLNNAQMLRSLQEGRGAGNTVGASFGADFVVLGKTSAESAGVVIPDFKGGYRQTPLNSGRAEMTAKIIRLDTGDVLSTFTVDSKSMEANPGYAEREAMKDIARQASVKVEEKFRRIGANADTGGIQVTAVIRGSDNTLTQLVNDLKSIPGVNNVFLREQNGGRAKIAVDTSMTASALVQALKSRTRLGVFADGMSAASATLIVS